MAAITKSEGRNQRTAHDELVQSAAEASTGLIAGRAALLEQAVRQGDKALIERSVAKLQAMLEVDPPSHQMTDLARFVNGLGDS